MGNTESMVVQKRLSRFCPEDRPMIEGVFDRLQVNVAVPAGAQKKTPAGNTLTFEMLQSSMCMLASDSMIKGAYHCMRSIKVGTTADGKVSKSAASGVCRDQLIIFLADTLLGTAEERAPLVMAMSQGGTCTKVVTHEQVTQFLQDLISAVFKILVYKGHLRGWKPEKMGDGSHCGKLLAEQICSELKPTGDSVCFLFSVFPSLRVYTATGYNDHFMYLNQNQQTMPNGLGMGGQHSYFGLWLDSDFGHGHSRARPKCTTFGSPQLSGDEEFILDSMEVWAVGKSSAPQECADGDVKRSVFNINLEDQAIMEMTGKELHSQGFRELDEDQRT